MDKQNLTKTYIAQLPYSDKEQLIADTEVPWLVLRIGKKSKTFMLIRKFEGKQVKVKIGDANLMNPALARKRALEMVVLMQDGHNPKKPPRAGVTLGETWSDFKRDRNLRPKSLRSYELVFKNHLNHLLESGIDRITGDEVRKIHRDLGEKGQGIYANQVMRVLRSVLNYAKGEYRNKDGESLMFTNPVQRLSDTKTWFREKRRKTAISADLMPEWIRCVEGLHDKAVSDYFMLLLLTGLRREEATGIRWANVNLVTGYFTIPGDESKNYDDHTLPMTRRTRLIFERRLAVKENEFVFPSNTGISHLVNTRRQRDRLVKENGIVWTPHDLRRTFATVAESLEISSYTLKRMLNHRMEADVTAGYISWHPSRLLKPLQRIEDQLLGVTPAPKSEE